MTRHGLLASLLATTALAGLVGCSGQGDIDRTQPDKVQKSIFFNADGSKKTFYFRQTVTQVPTTTGWTMEGDQGPLNKVKFEITENYLLAYQAFEAVPGSENAFTGGNNNQDVPVAVWKIRSHFDVKREYNSATGEQTNVISENQSDRPWYSREFMRVDWSMNAAQNYTFAMDYYGAVGLVPVVFDVREGDVANPDRPIVTGSYIDISSKYIASPDFYSCYTYWSPIYDDGGAMCGGAEIKVRNSFMEVKPSDYEPREYPDRVPLLDSKGQPVRYIQDSSGNAILCTPENLKNYLGGEYTTSDCTEAGLDVFQRFGFFRTVRQQYDRQAGVNEANRKYYANRWNIWEKSKDADGKPLPYSQRKVKPIVYYKNVEWPDDQSLHDAAKELTSQWNDAFRNTVAALIISENNQDGIPLSDIEAMAKTVPDVFILKDNDCSIANVQKLAGQYKDLNALAERVAGPVASLTKENLQRVCTAFESVTQTLPDGDAKKFKWQRNGDLRYSFLWWVDRPQLAGPLGFGPSSADPETGEIISASAYNYGAALDTYVKASVDLVQALNQNLSVDDIVTGKTLKDVIAENDAAMKAMKAQKLSKTLQDAIGTKLGDGSASGPVAVPGPAGALGGKHKPRLVKLQGSPTTAQWEALKGTPVEARLINEDILAMFQTSMKPGQGVDADLMERAAPRNWITPAAREKRRAIEQKMSKNGCLLQASFLDDSIYGLALELSNLPPDEMFKKIRNAIFRGLAQHEIGHTLGLRHNFSASNDALNYFDTFWSLEKSAMTDDEKKAAKITQYKYSSVMDYGAKFNSDVEGLGKYDHAAIRFGYGNLVDVMPNAQYDSDSISTIQFLFDYKKLPDYVGSTDVIAEHIVRPFSAVQSEVRGEYQKLVDAPADRRAINHALRPYKFCSDEFNGNYDCKTWDEGGNQQEIVESAIGMYKNYYYFNAFQRGRLGWSINSYLNRLLNRYFVRFTEAFQFYYFFGDYYKQVGLEYDVGYDLLKASLEALNTLGDVLQTPEPGTYCVRSNDSVYELVPYASYCKPDAKLLQVDVGQGKPFYINFSDDYYYRITRAGSLYEKLAALIALTTSEANFFRVDTFADRDRYSISYYRIFKDEVLNLLDGIIRNDVSNYGGAITLTQDSTMSFRNVPIVDMENYGEANYQGVAVLPANTPRIETPVTRSLRDYAIILSLVNLNSAWDSTLDSGEFLRVAQVGSGDDITVGLSTDSKVFTNPLTGQQFKAWKMMPDNPQSSKASISTGYNLVSELVDIVGDGANPTTLDGARYGRAYKYYYNAKNQVCDWVDNGTIYIQEELPTWKAGRQTLIEKQKAAADAAVALGADPSNASLQTAKAEADCAYKQALDRFNSVDGALSYRVDILNDLRYFRRAVGLE